MTKIHDELTKKIETIIKQPTEETSVMALLFQYLEDMQEGLTTTSLGHESRMATLEEEIAQLKENEEITTEQVTDLQDAARKRIHELIGDDPDVHAKYYKIFAGRLWTDMKHNCGMGSRIAKTRKKDFEKVIKGIQEWKPAEGVKELMDKRDAVAKANMEAKDQGYD